MGLTGKQKAGVGLGLAGIAVAIATSMRGNKPPPVDPNIPTECAFGEPDLCFGSDLYRCSSKGEWELKESNSPQCTPEKQIRLDDLTIMPSLPKEGDTVYIKCRATNHSAAGETLSRAVDLAIDGVAVTGWDLTLQWAESIYLEYSIIAEGIGTHTVEFDGLAKSFEVVTELLPNLLIPESTKVFDGKALYPQLLHPDADIAYKNRAMETADFEVINHSLYIPSNDKAIWSFEGTWDMGDNRLLYMGPVLRLIEESSYDSAVRHLPSSCTHNAPDPICYGYEDYYNKFTECCIRKGYLPEWDWWKWVMETDWVIGFVQSSVDPVSVANGKVVSDRLVGLTSGTYQFYAESFFGWNWHGWHYPPTNKNWVAILEINVALKYLSGDKHIYPLYAWKVGRLSF